MIMFDKDGNKVLADYSQLKALLADGYTTEKPVVKVATTVSTEETPTEEPHVEDTPAKPRRGTK